mgnify:CR=1 FL=1
MSALLDYDTGPLNWVRGDIDAALQAALGRIQAFSVDADLINALRLARDDAHQATGALRMVGLEGAATLAGTIESCLSEISENALQASDEIVRALRNAIEGLQRWVKDLADGRGNFWASLNNANGFAAVMTMMMTGVVIISLMYRASPRTPYRFSWDGIALIFMYLGSILVLYFLG